MFRDPSCECAFCTVSAKSTVRYAGYIQYLVIQDHGTYSIPNDYLPMGSSIEETECLSQSG